MPTNFSSAASNIASQVREAVVDPAGQAVKEVANDTIESVTGVQSSAGTQNQNPNQAPNQNKPEPKDPLLEKQETERKRQNILQFLQQSKADSQHLQQQKNQQEQAKKQEVQQAEEQTQIKQYEVKQKQNMAVNNAKFKTESKKGRG